VIRRCVVGAFGVGLVVALGSPAVAQPDYPAPTPVPPSVSASTVVQGESVTFTAGGFTPGTTVAVMDNGVQVGTATADANGVFVLAVTVANCGANSLTATGVGDNGPVSVSAAVQGVSCTNPTSTVPSATAGRPTATALPRTGNSLAVPGALTGTALVLLGGTAVVVSRRRREDQPDT